MERGVVEQLAFVFGQPLFCAAVAFIAGVMYERFHLAVKRAKRSG